MWRRAVGGNFSVHLPNSQSCRWKPPTKTHYDSSQNTTIFTVTAQPISNPARQKYFNFRNATSCVMNDGYRETITLEDRFAPVHLRRGKFLTCGTGSTWARACFVFVNCNKAGNVNKNPTRCNSMQIFIYCKVTLHVSGVTAPIIRSTKNGTGHNTGTATSLQRGLIRPRWRGCAVTVLWHPKHV